MEKLPLLLFLFSHMLKAFSENLLSDGMLGWWRIDCGIDDAHIDGNLTVWEGDLKFTRTGFAKLLLVNRTPFEELNSLRYYPNQTLSNCYTLPTALGQSLRYLIRAGFYYGNYDGLGNPPTFDLSIDDVKWSTVITSSVEGPVFLETVYVTRGSGSISVCLWQTREGEVPFISSLEATPLGNYLYPYMQNYKIYNLVIRTNLGGEEVRTAGSFLQGIYNRVWTRGVTPPNCISVATLPDFFPPVENDPPYTVLADSLMAINPSDSMILTVDFPQRTLHEAYFVFYITELTKPNNIGDVRKFQIEINGNKEYTVAPLFGKCMAITIYPVTIAGPTINITLVPTHESTLAPIISAMEIFTSEGPKPVDDEKSGCTTPDYFFSTLGVLIHILCLAVLLLP